MRAIIVSKKKKGGKANRTFKQGDSFKLQTVVSAETIEKRAQEMADIEILRKKEQISEKPTKTFEINAVVGLFASLGAMKMVEDDLKVRIQSVKGGARDYGAAKSMLWRSIQRVLATMPDEKVASLLAMKDHLGFRTYLDRRVADSDESLTVLKMNDLETLVSASHEFCKMCDRNCDRCVLGKTLDRVQPDTREKGHSWSMMDIGDFTPGNL